jgi:hypothetical protein
MMLRYDELEFIQKSGSTQKNRKNTSPPPNSLPDSEIKLG